MYQDIIELLDEKRLKEALTQLNALIAETEVWPLKTQLENLRTTYSYLLQYAAQGTNDPERQSVYTALLRNTYELTEMAEFERKCKKSNGYFYGKSQTMRRIPPRSFNELQSALETFGEESGIYHLNPQPTAKQENDMQLVFQQHAKDVDELFDKIWTSNLWQDNEYQEACILAESVSVPVNDLAVFIGAVTLNLQQLPDCKKILLLMKIYQTRTENILTQRALTGIALSVYRWGKRLNQYPELMKGFQTLNESGKWCNDLTQLQLMLLQTRETEKIEKKMREEIIPQLLRNSQFMEDHFNIDDIEEMREKNPDWEKETSNIDEQIHALNTLQSEGADTMMGTFVHLKSSPFFRQAAHWFYPFDSSEPTVAPLFRDKSARFLQMVLNTDQFCNSDKYSFATMLLQIPQDQQKAIADQLLHLENSEEGLKEQLQRMGQNSQDSTTVLRQYIQDLYRFYKLWHYRGEQEDVFKQKLDLWNGSILGSSLNTPEQIKQIADHLFQKEYMEEATTLYKQLADLGNANAEIWQKLGFAYQKNKQYEPALDAYHKADLLKPDHIWTLKHLAQCYRSVKQYRQAVEYYTKVETMQPDNLNLIQQLGQCYTLLKQYDKALAYFFKQEYLGKNVDAARRAIGWCYFMTGKYTDALRFYSKLEENGKTQPSDWLNTGHIYLAQQNVPQALNQYRKAAGGCSSHDDFIRMFLSDSKSLLEQGISDEYLYLIPEMI